MESENMSEDERVQLVKAIADKIWRELVHEGLPADHPLEQAWEALRQATPQWSVSLPPQVNDLAYQSIVYACEEVLANLVFSDLKILNLRSQEARDRLIE